MEEGECSASETEKMIQLERGVKKHTALLSIHSGELEGFWHHFITLLTGERSLKRQHKQCAPLVYMSLWYCPS